MYGDVGTRSDYFNSAENQNVNSIVSGDCFALCIKCGAFSERGKKEAFGNMDIIVGILAVGYSGFVFGVLEFNLLVRMKELISGN
jgi:hypothetical protein